MAATNNHHDIPDHQVRLSEHLQLLSHLRYSDGKMPYKGFGHSNKATRDHNTLATLRILDTISVALTTGKSEDVFAAAFDRRQGLKLVLAKNDNHTDEDDQAVRDLIKVVTASSTKDAYDVFPFLLSRCGENMERRMMKMVEALTRFSQDLDEILKGYSPDPSLDQEFPKSADYRQKTYPHDDPSVPQMMRQLLADITLAAKDFNTKDSKESMTIYKELVVLVPLLQKSRLLRSLCDDTNRRHLTRKLQAERLDRRLAKVSQYYRGIQSLIKHARRYFPDGVEHHWVNVIPGTGHGEMLVELEENYLPAISRALDNPLSPETVARVKERFPKMAESWRNHRFLHTRVHAEIRILLYLSDSLDALDRFRQQPIGCSKRSCLCCTSWIRQYNGTFATRWLTSWSDGKPSATWALPGSTYAHARESGRSIVDEAVMDRVENDLSNILDFLFPGQRREYSPEWPESDEMKKRAMDIFVAKFHQEKPSHGKC